MTDKRYDLKLSDGRIVSWLGTDPIDASTRYVDAMRIRGEAVAVVAWREPTAQGTVSVLGDSRRIIG